MRRELAGVLLASLAVLVGMSGLAHADTKYTRKTTDVKVDSTDRVQKIEPKKQEKPAAAAVFTADQFFRVEQAVQGMQLELIDEYKAAIEDADDDDPRKLDLMFRLAEAYAQQQRFEHSMAMEAATKADKERDKGKKAKLAKEQQQREAASKKWQGLASKAYAAMLQHPKFNKYPRADEVLFYLAYTLQQAGQKDLAFKAYQRLTKDFPNSKYIPNAYVAIADQYFKENNLTEAEKFYEKVIKFPKHEVYPYALYMRGWVRYNQARPKDSYADWVTVAGLVKGRKDQSLFRAARKDVVRAYAEFGDETIAYKAFQKIDPSGAEEMYAILGNFYLDQGKMAKVIYVFRDLMKMSPKSPSVCEWEYTVVRAMLTIGTPEQKVKELGNLVELYTYLAKNKVIKGEALQQCKNDAEETTRQMAYVTHQECKKTLNAQLCGYAHGYYKVYTRNFTDTEEASEVQFFYAELLWLEAEWEKNPSLASARWEECAIEYSNVVERGKVDEKRIKEAAYASVLAWKNALAIDITKDKPPEVAEKDECDANAKGDEIPEKQQKMIAAFDTYIKYVNDPKDEELWLIKFYKGRIYWRYKHYDEAIPLFEDIIKNRPGHVTAETAVNLLIDSQNRTCKFGDLLKVAKSCVEAKGPWKELTDGKADLTEYCGKIVALGKRKECEGYEKEGRWYEAGTCYVDVAQNQGGAGDLDQILFNAGVCFERAKAFQNAIQVREALIANFPKTRYGQQSLYAIGVNKAAIGEFRQSAEYFEKYAKQFSGEKDAPTALSNAVFFRKGSGDDQQALDNTDYYVKLYIKKNPADAATAFFSMSGIFEKNRKYDDLVRHLDEYLKRFGAKGGVDRQIIAHVKMGEVAWRQSCPERGPNGSCIKVTRAKVDKAAARRKKRGNEKRTQCGPESKIKAQLIDRKPALLKEARGHFEAAVKLWKGGKANDDVPGKDDGEKKGRAADMLYYVGMAKFYLADIAFEEVLSVKLPALQWDGQPGPDGKKSKKDQKADAAFEGYIKTKDKMIAEATKKYLELQDVHPFWAVAGAARVGQMLQNFSDQLFTTPIPDIVQKLGEDTVDFYCDKMAEAAGVLEDKSIAAYKFCLDTSLAKAWFSEWSQLCEAELGQIRPQDYPTAAELRGAPDRIPLTIGMQPMLTEIKK